MGPLVAVGAFVIMSGVRNPGGTRIVHATMQKQYTVLRVRNRKASPLK